jgi:sirohydrochlorin cobaltochelatase
MSLPLALALALGAHAAAPSSAPASSPASYGILLLAHGGDKAWNAEVERLRLSVDREVPVETALGMADAKAIASASERLKKRGAEKIVAVPLFVHSRSEVMDQTRYVLGMAQEHSEVLRRALEGMAKAHAGHAMPPGAHHHSFSMERAVPPLPAVLTDALDGDPLVSAVLLSRARGLSRERERESVVLVAHGPNDPKALPAWEKDLAAHAEFIARNGGFREARAFMLRDDAGPKIRGEAVKALRAYVEAKSSDGRVLVVPALLARGGIEQKIPKDLAGLRYAWDGRTLLPDPGFEKWLRARGASGAAQPDMRLPILNKSH